MNHLYFDGLYHPFMLIFWWFTIALFKLLDEASNGEPMGRYLRLPRSLHRDKGPASGFTCGISRVLDSGILATSTFLEGLFERWHV